jgi:predicted dehydrogenase
VIVDSVGLAAIGLGTWGGRLAGAVAEMPGATPVACFASDGKAREEFAARHGCQSAETLESVFAYPAVADVLIATPHSTHEQIAVAAATAGKHVFVVKSLAAAENTARRIHDLIPPPEDLVSKPDPPRLGS